MHLLILFTHTHNKNKTDSVFLKTNKNDITINCHNIHWHIRLQLACAAKTCDEPMDCDCCGACRRMLWHLHQPCDQVTVCRSIRV